MSSPGNAWQLRLVGPVPPKGSARSFAIRRGGVYTGRTVTVQGNAERLAEWAARCALAARHAGVPLDAGPWHVHLDATFARPKCHYRGGRPERGPRPTAPDRHTGKPDLDKLLRTVLDALTGIAWPDDSAVCALSARKCWATVSGAVIVLRRVGPEDATEPEGGDA